jgi:hypothetical protein
MVETITPVVHGGRRGRWAGSVALHALGTTAVAAIFGAALGAAGGVLGAPWGGAGLLAVTAVAGLYAARELFGVPVPVPDRRRQVPEWWRTQFGPPVASFLYGLGLGVGFLTFLRHGTLVAVAAAALASGDPLIGLVMLAPFGLARAATVALAAGGTSSHAVARILDRLDRWATSPLTRVANAIALVALTAVAAAAALGAPPKGVRELGAAALALVFGWAAGAKVFGFRSWSRSLEAFGLGRLRRTVAAGVPLAELAVPALVVSGHPAAAGTWALVLLAGFSAGLVRARLLQGPDVPCGCLGRAKRRDYRLLLARNGLLASVGAAVALRPPAARSVLGVPGSTEVLPAALVGLAVLAAALMLREMARLQAS